MKKKQHICILRLTKKSTMLIKRVQYILLHQYVQIFWYVTTLTNKYCKTGVGERKLQWSWFVKACIASNVFFFASENTASLKKNLELMHSWETCFGALVHLSCFLYIFMQMFWWHWLSIFCNFKHFNFLKHYEIN